MNTFDRATRPLACGALILLVVPAAAQQLTTPYVANSANSAVSEIIMDPPLAMRVNTGLNLHSRLTSLTARSETLNGGTDLAVNLYGTDQSRGQLIEWVGPTNETPVPPSILWVPANPAHSAAGALKPTAPTGISDDPEGNLYVVHSTGANNKPTSVWVFRNDEVNAGNGVPPRPRVIDRNAGVGSAVARVLEETVVAPLSTGLVERGDLLVLSRNPAMVLAYPLDGSPGIADILAEPCGVSCDTDVTPIVLVSGSVEIEMPNGSTVPFRNFDPTGMDFYGDKLLITTGRGEILEIDLGLLADPDPLGLLSPTRVFRQGLGNGKSRVKTGFQGGSTAVFVTNQNRGSLLRFLDDGAIVDEVRGLQNPEGLALSVAAYERITNCVVGPGSDGCDPAVTDDGTQGGDSQVFKQSISNLLGGAPGNGININPNSNVLQDFCIVEADQVSAIINSLPAGTSPKIDDFCPGWGDEVNPVIPPYLIRDGEPLVFVKTTSPGLVITHGLVQLISDEFNLVPDFEEGEECPNFRTAWSPSELGDTPVSFDDEGNPVFEENLTGCGSLLRLGRGGSFHMIGPFTADFIEALGAETIDEKMHAFVLEKFDLLQTVIAATQSDPGNLMVDIDGCVWWARHKYDVIGSIPWTLQYLAACDAIVSATTPGQLTSDTYGNPAGDILWRIRNIVFTISEHADL